MSSTPTPRDAIASKNKTNEHLMVLETFQKTLRTMKTNEDINTIESIETIENLETIQNLETIKDLKSS